MVRVESGPGRADSSHGTGNMEMVLEACLSGAGIMRVSLSQERKGAQAPQLMPSTLLFKHDELPKESSALSLTPFPYSY